jgi:hypothetical protein
VLFLILFGERKVNLLGKKWIETSSSSKTTRTREEEEEEEKALPWCNLHLSLSLCVFFERVCVCVRARIDR